MTKPVQVYILLGQSNMVGAGKIGPETKDGSLENATKKKGKYPYLVDDAGNWTERKDVRYARVMGSGTGRVRHYKPGWMTVMSNGGNIGPEVGIGYVMGHLTDAPVLILKSCIGNRSLGWDLLPPGSKQFEATDPKSGKTFVYAGYKESPDKWEKGTEPKKIGWYAGMQYDGDIANAKKILSELEKAYPGAREYEVAGFFFWQGDKDRYNDAHADRYEQNLVQLINQLRKDFNAPKAKFVCATLGQTRKDANGNEAKILEAQLAVDGKTGKYPQFKGNVASVYANPFCHGGASNSHYGNNAETYMDTGEAMGWAMADLVSPKKCCGTCQEK
ncbi:MAG: sialate O-acetylesterase [Phycisphaerae bacterium]|nr:sialate O-acetylesterase [Phycisphaerae bacterium]